MNMLTMLVLPLGVIGPWQWVIIALVIILLFGGKKIPELMRGLGKGVKEFKNGMQDAEREMNDIRNEIDKPSDTKKVE